MLLSALDPSGTAGGGALQGQQLADVLDREAERARGLAQQADGKVKGRARKLHAERVFSSVRLLRSFSDGLRNGRCN